MNKEDIKKEIITAIKKVKKENPMAPSITNTVTINFVANTQLAAGGSAAMVYLPDEGETVATIANAVYINVGTLFPIYEKTLPRTAKKLQELGKNWVLDPVAVGIGELREKLLSDFKENKPPIIRGNASEIIALANLWNLLENQEKSKVRGVDSTETVSEAKRAAIAICKYTKGAVSVSGEVDLITDGNYLAYSHGGSKLFSKITGAGCALGGLSAVYACCASPFIAALSACQAFNFSGSNAEKIAKGPASFQTAFLDVLYSATAEEIANNNFDFEKIEN